MDQGDDEFVAVDLHSDQVGCFAGAVVVDEDGELLRLLQVGGDVGLDGIRFASASRVEGARARLKRPVERGWLVEEKPGRFTLPTQQRTDEAVQPGGGS
ncbi:hypothetical protein [Streptomyces sp. NPDC058145]|uniref:hypothetical protein n=1 Tax=Streptomyces sp. NPDC058145 TaxID=3346356 RepID=UPI0036E9C005